MIGSVGTIAAWTRVLFGKNVARLRQSRGLSQTQLVFVLDPAGRGISQSYLSQLKAGKRDPKLSTIVEIATALGVAVKELVAGCDAVEPVISQKPNTPRGHARTSR